MKRIAFVHSLSPLMTKTIITQNAVTRSSMNAPHQDTELVRVRKAYRPSPS